MPTPDKSAPGQGARGQASPVKAGSTVLAALLLAVSALTWAGNYITGRAISGEVPPIGLAAGRWGVAVLVMLPLAWSHLQRDRAALSARWRYIVVMGIIGAGYFGTVQYAGLQFTTAANGGLLSATSPVWIALAGAAMFADRLSARQVAGLAISMSGALVIVAKGDPANLASLRFNVGDLMILTSLAAWGIYSALLRKRPAVHWSSFTVALFAVAFAVNLPFAGLEHALGWPMPMTWPALAAVLYTGVVASVIGFVAWNRGVEIIGSQRAGVYLNLIPIFTVMLAVLLLGERLMGFHLVACALVFAGLWLATTPRKA